MCLTESLGDVMELDGALDEGQDETLHSYYKLYLGANVQEPVGYTPPVTYDKDVPTTSKLSKFIFKDGLETCAISKRLSQFRKMRKLGLFSLDVKPELAEAKVIELLKIYLYIKTNNGELKKISRLLRIAITICILHKISNDAYVSYAVQEHMRLKPFKSIFNSVLMQYTQVVQYWLHQTRNIRVYVVGECTYTPKNAAQIAEERQQIHWSVDKLLPFINVPCTKPDDYGHLFYSTLNEIMETVDAPPDVALLMMRYGATPRHPFSGIPHARISPANFLCQYIARLLKQEFMEQPIRETFKAVTENDEMQNLFKMLQYMLRADPYFIVTYTSMYNWNDGLDDKGYREIRPSTLRQEPSENQPTIDSRLRDHFLPPCLTESVSSLLRLSRYVIRGVLLQNRQLPDGIKLLQIPELLKPYLDLLLD